MTEKEIQQQFAQHILDVEARRDRRGRLVVYDLPSGDGGGAFEVAGINVRYHPRKSKQLRRLIQSGRHGEAESVARDYLVNYTNSVDEWHPNEVVEGYLRSVAFNRGAGGAAWVLQYALRYAFAPSLYTGRRDRKVGPKTKAASKKADAPTLFAALYGARIVYERTAVPGLKAGRKEDSKFWHGLFRRFTNDAVFAYKVGKSL